MVIGGYVYVTHQTNTIERGTRALMARVCRSSFAFSYDERTDGQL